MFAYSLKKSELTAKRLDPNFYSPEQIVNEKKLSALSSEALESLRTEDAPIVYGILKPEGTSEGLYRVAKAEKFQGMFVDSDDCDEVSKTVYESFKRSVAKTGDVLIAIGGYVGRPAILNVKSGANCNINRHISRVRVDSSKIDPYYLVVFLSSRHGQKRLERQITGSVQAGINLEDLREVHVSLFEKATQKYIGDKVRQAEQLRAWAKRLEVKLAFFENQIPTSKPVIGEAKHSKATLEFLTENRLDARYYAKKHLDLYAQFNNEFESFGSICSGFKYGASIAANYVNSEGLPFIRGNALSPNRINQDDIVYLSKSLKDELKTAYVEEGDILITRSGTVGVTTYVAAEHAKYWYGSFIIKCKLATKSYLPAYVSWYLNSWVGQQQFRRLENGAVQLNINTEELSSIAIWKATQEFQTEIDKLLIEQISAVNLSKSLTSAAKTLVESLIEGQLTEQQLIQVQQALNDGDNSLDQAILSKLSNQGYAIDGATPLFSDIDELYRLLESAAQAEAEE
ncbi:hypothetical protein BM607_004660 [Shewanella sp. SACH]|uniref:restriction endonuclease subunit S n=1 Tax=Shewanella sp. SACH TaxID=1873135 RepID=UPI0009039838|nr:restriction endonuclease subunit S [Shewanella sp. SACH]OUS53217.1 hypothetical protein BM607_004660 [Shewanella sp. SACH]